MMMRRVETMSTLIHSIVPPVYTDDGKASFVPNCNVE